MRSLIFASCVVAVATAAGTDYPTLFTEFQAKHGRTYATKAEEAKRFGYFVDNMKIADAYTKLNPKAAFGVNAFADYSAAEFKTYHSGNSHFEATTKARGAEVAMSASEKKLAAGEKIDWRTKGAVTHVKNQGDCGSCWSFSTTGGIEGQWMLAGNPLTSLSEQELVSCDTIDKACQGGIMQNAFQWLMTNKDGKIVTAASYPYVSGMGAVPACDLTGKVFGAQITGHVDVAKHETDMAAWVYKHGPLSIAVDATTWQTYTGGIMTNCAKVQIDHGVLIVGFDDTDATPYWIIKNSWGPSWGESGYIRVAKGTDQCLITTDPTSSTVPGGSGPTPSSPPVTNTPGTPSAMFTSLYGCTTPDCTNCKSKQEPQNTCIMSGAFSFKAECATDSLIVKEYNNADCAGSFNMTSQSINTCNVNFGKHGMASYNEVRCPNGPMPPAPTVTSPPAPGPTSSPSAPTTPSPAAGKTFTQKTCTNSACTSGCQSHTFPQDQCLGLQGGGSAKATCTATDLTLTEYPSSTSCTGFSIPTTQPINQCAKDQQGTYFENSCTNSLIAATKGDKFHTTADLAAKVAALMKRN